MAIRVRLFVIFAVLLASLVTVSQRADTQEATLTHWLEVHSEQTLSDLPLLEKDEKVDADFLVNHSFFQKTFFSDEANLYSLTKAPHHQYKENHLPRAPPYSLI